MTQHQAIAPASSSTADTPHLRREVVTAYAITSGPIAILSLPFSVYLPPYIADGGVISVGLVGLLFSLTTIWDGVVDPLIGTTVDRVQPGMGAHRRWMLRALVPLLLLLVVIVSVGDRLPFAALFVLMLLFYSSYSLYDVAQLAWGAALVRTPDDSSRLFGARIWFAKFALVAAFAAPALAQALIPGLSLQGRILAYSSLILVTVPLALLAIRRLPLRPIVAETGLGWKYELKSSLTFSPLLLLLGVHFLNSFAFGSLTALFVFFNDAVLGLDGQSAILLFASFVGGALTTPVWTMLARRYGKPPMFMAMGAFVSALLLLTLIFRPTGFAQALVFSTLLGSGFVGQLFSYGLLADLVPLDRERCRRDRSAFLFAIVNLMQKFGVAAAIGISYAMLDLIGFDPKAAAQSARELHLLFALLPAIGWGAMILLLVRMRRLPAFA